MALHQLQPLRNPQRPVSRISEPRCTAYAVAMRHPGLVQGVAGLVGFVPEENANALESAPLQHLPIFMAVGKEDHLIPQERTQLCAQTLRQAQAQLTYNEYDTGHKLNAQGMRDLKAWWADRQNSLK